MPVGAGALLGAAAVLAAAIKGPLSAVALMAELTRQLDATMVPVLLAVAGALLVARALEPRSIFSGRIHDARRAAERRQPPTISAAVRYPDFLRALPVDGAPLNVVDEAGEALGTVSADRARHLHCDDGPLATAAAGDFIEAPRGELLTPAAVPITDRGSQRC